MKLPFLNLGTIVNTHGVRGELKLQPREVDAEFLLDVDTLYVDNKPYTIKTARVHKGCLLITLPGVEDMNAALAFKGKPVTYQREDLGLEEDEFFSDEVLQMEVFDEATGEALGKIIKVLPYPAHDVYVVKGEKEFMVPAVPAFISSMDFDANRIEINVWEGLF